MSHTEDSGFPRDYFNRQKRQEFSEIQKEVVNLVGQLAGELDISINKSSSEPMRSFVEKMLSLGIRIGITDPSINLEDGFIQLSQSRVNDSLKIMSDLREEYLLEKFQKNIKFVNILLDTGTINKFKMLHFIISNPNFSMDIWPYDNYENRDFEGNDYTLILNDIINRLISQGIEPVAIIGDQLPAQVKGICNVIKNGESNLFKSIIHIPCISHISNLVYGEILALEEFEPYLKEIDDLINFCRNIEIATQIGKYCPTLVKTRWVYLSEVLDFFETYLYEINMLRTANDLEEISLQIIEFGKILKPLMDFTYFTEKRNTKLSDILPKIKETIELIQNLKDELVCTESIQVHRFVLATFIARMQSLPLNILKTAFAISLEGRNYIRYKFGINIRNGNNESNNDENQILSDSLNSYFENENQTAENQIIENQVDANENDSDTEVESFEYSAVDELEEVTEIDEIDKTISLEDAVQKSKELMSTQERHDDFIKFRNSIMEDPNFTNYDWYEDIVPITEETIRRQMNLLGIQNEESAVLLLRNWWFESELEGFDKISPFDTTDSYWRRLITNSNTKDLAYICLRFASIGASEAEVERLFSIQKNMLSRSAVNVGTATLHHRCILHCTKQ